MRKRALLIDVVVWLAAVERRLLFPREEAAWLLPLREQVRTDLRVWLALLEGVFADDRRANFLDVGGGATKERVSEAFKIILSDDSVKAVLVNIFGGIVRCDLIAEGIIGAVEEVGVEVPVIVRLEGNNAELGSKLLAESGLNIIAANSLSEAAEAVVKAAEGK